MPGLSAIYRTSPAPDRATHAVATRKVVDPRRRTISGTMQMVPELSDQPEVRLLVINADQAIDRIIELHQAAKA